MLGQYKHQEIESKWQQEWLEKEAYKWNSDLERDKNFVIDTPPPTVSGLLHMGHIFSYTQADIIARFQRMNGKNVFYPMGFDDNGLPTERLVEKVKKVRPQDVGREKFRELCYDVVEKAEEEFFGVFNRIGLSVDWSQKYQTISDHSRRISQSSFLDLFAKGELYRDMEPCLWDPKDCTALAQADIEDKKSEGFMYEIKFFDESGKEHVIATTRPEMLPACVAVFCHPEDERYKPLHKGNLITPLFEKIVPVICDDKVDMEKGTGLVMCCTFGDVTDIEWWKKYDLPLIDVLDHYGKLRFEGKNLGFEINAAKQDILSELEGKKTKLARDIIAEHLQSKGFIVKSEKVTKSVKCAERSGAEIEILVTPQWMIKVLDKKGDIKKKAREVRWFPPHMYKRLENWVDGLGWNWCISRQRYFGVPIPVWYSKRAGEEGKVLLPSFDQLPVDPISDLPSGYSREEVEAETDVLDTWATSSLTPQINSGSINKELSHNIDRHNKLFPADLRPQAHEIIRTWTFYTMVKSLIHADSAPWKNIAISGWCLAEDKTKMSKSKGNSITPLSLIDAQGADVVRYWTSSSKLGSDIVYSEANLAIGQKFVKKLWNATKFAYSHLQNFDIPNCKDSDVTHFIDKWLLSKLIKVIDLSTDLFEKNEYFEARKKIEDFFWNDLCDHYLEIVKKRVYNQGGDDKTGQKSAQTTLCIAFEVLLKILAPFVPFITEELYSTLYSHKSESIHSRGSWPSSDFFAADENITSGGDLSTQIIDEVRKAKTDKQLSMNSEIDSVYIAIKNQELVNDANLLQDIKNVTCSRKIFINATDDNIDLANAVKSQNNEFEITILF